MLAKEVFHKLTYEKKKSTLLDIIIPLKEKKKSFEKAYEIVMRPGVSEKKLASMYVYIFDTIDKYKQQKKAAETTSGVQSYEAMRLYLHKLAQKEQQEEGEHDLMERELESLLESLDEDVLIGE